LSLLLVLSGGIGWLRQPGLPWRALVVSGLAQTGFQVLLILGLQLTTVSTSAILLATAPLLTAGWLAATGQARPSPRACLGLLLGIAGVALVIRPDRLELGWTTVLGNLVALGSAATWAWYGLAIRPLAAAVGPVRASAGSIGVAGVLLVPFWLPQAGSVDWTHISLQGWAGLVYGATLGMVFATILWVRSVRHHGTQTTMNYGYVEPVAAVLIAALLLGELLEPIQALGGALALAGVWLASDGS
jgi:drug/metabolite transporter (DMT)-like permease